MLKSKKVNINNMSPEDISLTHAFDGERKPRIFKDMNTLIVEVNTKVTQRGIPRGLVCYLEEFNKNCIYAEENVAQAYNTKKLELKMDYLNKVATNITNIWILLNNLYKLKALTSGELRNLSINVSSISKQLELWINSVGQKVLKEEEEKEIIF